MVLQGFFGGKSSLLDCDTKYSGEKESSNKAKFHLKSQSNNLSSSEVVITVLGFIYLHSSIAYMQIDFLRSISKNITSTEPKKYFTEPYFLNYIIMNNVGLNIHVACRRLHRGIQFLLHPHANQQVSMTVIYQSKCTF